MEENKLIKYKVGLVQRVSDVIGITNKLLRDSPILEEDNLIDQQQENIQIQAMLAIKKQVLRARLWKARQRDHFKFVGENNRQIVILINEFTEEYIQPSSMKYLLAILKACKLELDDVAIINITKEKIELTKIMNLFSPKVILLFGIKNTDLNSSLNLNINQIFTYDKCEILVTTALNPFAPLSEKSELWYNLKSIFHL